MYECFESTPETADHENVGPTTFVVTCGGIVSTVVTVNIIVTYFTLLIVSRVSTYYIEGLRHLFHIDVTPTFYNLDYALSKYCSRNTGYKVGVRVVYLTEWTTPMLVYTS